MSKNTIGQASVSMRNQGVGADQISNSNKSPSDRNLSPFKSYPIPDSSTFRKKAKKSNPSNEPRDFKESIRALYKAETEITSE